MPSPLTVGLLLNVASLAASLGAAEPAKTINYRHDGTGVFPARGLPRSFSERHNILWKTPLPHYGMNAPVVVGNPSSPGGSAAAGKVFVSCDPGWTSDAPLLVAVDKASGAIAWQAAVDPLDAPEWSETDRTECKRLRAENYEHLRTLCRLNWRLAQATDEKTRATVIAEGAQAGLVLNDPEKDKRFSFPKDHPRLLNQALLRRKRVFIEGRFIGEGERFFTGLTMSSIVSDGERIYVQNALDAVACFDLSGRRLWIHDLRLNPPTVLTTASWGWGCSGWGGQQGASAITAEGRCLFVRSNDNLYCLAALVHGGRGDDLTVISALSGANEAAPLVAHLGDPVPRHRHTTIRRLGTLKVPLTASAAQTLNDLAVNDLYEEIRAAAVETLDACDPAGKAATQVLLAETEACQVGPKAEGRHLDDMWWQERRERLEHTWAALGEGGKTRLESLWPDLRTNGLRMRSVLSILARTGWKCQPALTEALAIVQELRGPKTEAWHQHGYPHRPAAIAFLPIWLNAIDAAADPAATAILVKAFPQDLRLHQTLSHHLSAEHLLAWLEPMAAKADPRQQHYLLLAWKALDAQAKPSLERILAQLPASAAEGKVKPFAERIREVMTE